MFVTRYACGWMGYTSPGSAYSVLYYDWLSDFTGNFAGTGVGGFNPFGIDRVFAHETGHIFGAPDEYANSACAVTDTPQQADARERFHAYRAQRELRGRQPRLGALPDEEEHAEPVPVNRQ